MITFGQEKSPGADNTEALQTNNTNGLKSIEASGPFQAASERMDSFTRLERAFDSIGWNLFYLDGESCVAVHRRWQMSQVCPDLRTANALLRRIGGAA